MTMLLQPTDAEWEEINTFKMPPVKVDDLVVWFNQGDTGSDPKWGRVLKVENRTIVVVKQSQDEFNRVTESCRHKDDPELRFKPNLRLKGTWDFHPAHKEREARLKWIEDRLTSIERGGLNGLSDAEKKSRAESAAQARKADEAETKANLKAISEMTTAREQDIVDFSAQGMKPGEIADVLGVGWTALRVGKVLKNTALTPTAVEATA